MNIIQTRIKLKIDWTFSEKINSKYDLNVKGIRNLIGISFKIGYKLNVIENFKRNLFQNIMLN